MPPTPTTPYADVTFGDLYFGERLFSAKWTDASSGDKLIALKQATRDIDRLSFIGHKNDDTQENEFPRLDDTVVPVEVQQACAEQALALLKGLGVEELSRAMGITSEGVGDARRSYGKEGRQKLMARALGLSSVTAADLLREWVEDPRRIRFDRVG